MMADNSINNLPHVGRSLLWLDKLIHVKLYKFGTWQESHVYFFPFILDDKLDVNSNCVSNEQPEAETGIFQEDSNPEDSVEEEKGSLGNEAGLAGVQEAAAGPQLSEE